MDDAAAVALEAGAPGASGAPAPEPGPRDRSEALRWLGIAVAGLAVGLVNASLFGAVALAVTGTAATDRASLPLSVTVPTQLGLWTGLVAVPCAWLAVRRRGVVASLGLRLRLRDLPLGVGVGIAATVVIGILYALLLPDRLRRDLEEPARDAVGDRSGLAAVVLVLLLCVLTPIAEEVFFRGFLFPALRTLTRPLVGVLLGGVLFGLVHFQVLQLVGLATFGVALCLLAHRTGRIGAAVVAHATFNSITVVQLLAG